MTSSSERRRCAGLVARINQLEAALSGKDDAISKLEAQLQFQKSALTENTLYIQRLVKEKNELREKNAQLTLRLSSLSRKQSLNSGLGGSALRGSSSSSFDARSCVSSSSSSSLGPLPSSPPPSSSPTPTSSPAPLSPAPTLATTAFSFPPLPPTPESPRHVPSQTRPLCHTSTPMGSSSSTEVRPLAANRAAESDAAQFDYFDIDEEEKRQKQRKDGDWEASHKTRTDSIASLKDINLHMEEEGAGVVPPPNGGVLPSVFRLPTGQSLSESDKLRRSVSGSSSSNYATQNSLEEATTRPTRVSTGALTDGARVSDKRHSPLPRWSTVPSFPSGMKKSRSQESLDALREEEEDKIGDIPGVDSDLGTIRVRTVTISAGGKYKGLGRKNPRQVKLEAERLLRRTSIDTRRGTWSGRRSLDLISPDVEARIHEKVCFHIGRRYGGLERATRAALIIQRAYQQYKMRRRFNEMRREASQMRKRAQTVAHGSRSRKMSIIGRPRPRYHREHSTPSSFQDPLASVKERALKLRKERTGLLLGRADVDKQARRASSADIEEEAGQSLSTTNLLGGPLPPTSVSPPSPTEVKVTISGVCEEESSTDEQPLRESTDAPPLPTSFSSEQLLSGSRYDRPVSIFSVRSAISLQELREDEAGQQVRSPRQRSFTKETMRKTVNIGINLFNRKPIRGMFYLVLESILEDSPVSVAEFLLGEYGLSKEKIGEFLGEINEEFNMAVLECITEHVSMGDKPIDEALREFQQIFRMPGEAQKIDKIMQVFALEYFKHNKSDVIKSEDAAYILSFAIMMLHTALHNPSVRNRTTRSQWISMNRGVNEGENFPEQFLLDVYERILKTEFSTGQDHTQKVAQVERSIINCPLPRLATPQRRFVHQVVVNEIFDLNGRPGLRNKHKRMLFVFNDLVLVCKTSGKQQDYKSSFTLLHAIAVSFETHHYKNGVQIYSSFDKKAIFQCNCDSEKDRREMLARLEEVITELAVMEQERIADLGTSLSTTSKAVGGDKGVRVGGPVELHQSARRSSSLEDVRQEKGDSFVPGVGEIAVTSTTRGYRRRRQTSGVPKTEKRSSGDSGIESQQDTPTMSPVDVTTKSREAAAVTPSHPPPMKNGSLSSLNSGQITSMRGSHSNHDLKTMRVIPASTPPRSPSAEELGRRLSASVAESGDPHDIDGPRRGSKSKTGKKNRISLSSPFKSTGKKERSRSPSSASSRSSTSSRSSAYKYQTP